MRKKMTKAEESKGGRHANKVLNAERDGKGPPLSESYVGAGHHTVGHKGKKKKK